MQGETSVVETADAIKHVMNASVRRPWAIITGLSALLVTAVGAYLLERSRGFFTGGFLSVDHLEGPLHAAVFLAASFVVDAALIGFSSAIALWALSRARLRVSACMTGAALAGLLPLLVAEAVSYQIFRYLGDAFDLGLMFELTGGSVRELLAVASTHLFAPATMIAAAALGVVAVVWLVNRFDRGPRAAAVSASGLVPAGVLLLFGFVVLALSVRADAALENGLLRKASGGILALVANEVTDVDRDGYGVVGRRADPAPLDATVYPYARDLPGNGVDEDGVAGDLPRGAVPYNEPVVSLAPWQRRPDVVVIVLESFRADVVGAEYGGRRITPVMDAVARKGLSVAHAYSHNGYTVQSRYHLLTGALVRRPGALSLVDDFHRNGYVTGYFSGQDESFGGPEYATAFARADVAYDARDDRARRYSTSTTPGSLAVPYTVVQERVNHFLDERASSTAPLFVYVNFHDTHFPYAHDSMRAMTSARLLPREMISPGAREALWATYTNAAANVDAAIGDVLEAVRRTRGREPAVIITGDHGESLFDGGFLGHGYGLTDVQTRIPFIVANLPMTIAEPFGQIDVRSALSAALSVPSGAASMPVLRQEQGAALFQYLGELARPRQIAFLRRGARIIYDFRIDRVQTAGGPWQRPQALDGATASAFRRLIQQWELMNLAQDPEPAHVE
jgi:arylsulfatase A-like enzyme